MESYRYWQAKKTEGSDGEQAGDGGIAERVWSRAGLAAEVGSGLLATVCSLGMRASHPVRHAIRAEQRYACWVSYSSSPLSGVFLPLLALAS